MSYQLIDGAIRCLDCGQTSYNHADLDNRYCGACHRFHDSDPAEEDRAEAERRLRRLVACCELPTDPAQHPDALEIARLSVVHELEGLPGHLRPKVEVEIKRHAFGVSISWPI